MSNQNTSLQRTAAFYHSLGKVQTEINNLVGNELYKSSHNVRSNEVWMDPISYAPTFASASQYSDNVIVRQVGTSSAPVYLYPLAQSNYQSWFIDTGTPSVSVDGFIPSTGWVKPLINPSDVTNSAGAPSDGFQLQMFKRDGTTAVAYGSAYYDVDYYAGLIRFDANRTPIDTSGNSGLGFQFSQSAFEATSLTTTARKAYIQSTSTGGPRVIAWQYVGQLLNSYGGLGATGSQGFQGAQGLMGLQGVSGANGSQGSQGTSGLQGSSGVDGVQGAQGANGLQGAQGLMGFQGLIGATGIQGYQGIIGYQGATGAGANISVRDYNTGITYSGVENIIFRGGVVNIPGGGTAIGTLVTGASPTVVVWIPAPNYSGYFSPSFGAGGYSRYISTPTTNSYTSSVVPGQYDVGTWNTTSDFSASTTRNVTNLSGTLTAFTETDFACYNTSTTLSFYVYGADGTTVISSIVGYVLNGSGSTSSNGLTLTIASFTNDSDRYKASVSGSISVGTLFPNGGKFNWKIVHNNGEGAGYNNNGSTTYGIYEYTQTSPVFYDNDGTTSSASISSGVIFDELLATKVYYSGVAYYTTNSTFAFTASGINLLNDITIPTTNQITLAASNLAISGSFPGYADGSKSGVGSIITGWNLLWDKSGLTYSRTLTINTSGNYIPGFSTNNTVSSSPISYVTATVYDYGSVGNSQSSAKSMLIDTDVTGSVTYSDNPIDSENGRLSMTDVMSSGSSSFTSTVTLPSDELQYIFGRIIFPQTNFTLFYPVSNWTASVNYSGLTGSNKAFTVYTSLVASPTTTTLSLNDYRWHVTSYGKDASYLTSFTNGIFTFISNFAEADLEYNGSSLSSGTNDLVIIVGIDSSGNSTTPDRFLYVSGDPVTYATRQVPGTYNLDAGTKQIQWSKGSLSTTVKKVWLFIGYKNTTRGKNLYMSNIHFA